MTPMNSVFHMMSTAQITVRLHCDGTWDERADVAHP